MNESGVSIDIAPNDGVLGSLPALQCDHSGRYSGTLYALAVFLVWRRAFSRLLHNTWPLLAPRLWLMEAALDPPRTDCGTEPRERTVVLYMVLL